MIVAMGASLLLGGGRYLDVKTNTTNSGSPREHDHLAGGCSAYRLEPVGAVRDSCSLRGPPQSLPTEF